MASAFWHNRIKNRGYCVKNTVPLIHRIRYQGRPRLKTCGFSLFYLFFRSIVVSSLSVHSYASRLSADDFCSKSLCPRALVFWAASNEKEQDGKFRFALFVFDENTESSYFLPGEAVSDPSPTRPRRFAASSLILYLRTLPAAFIGKLSTNSMYLGTL